MSGQNSRAVSHESNCFDLLRLVFAVLVLLSHSYELIDGNRGRELLTRVFHTLSFGEFAVDYFFILSGFLITMSWDGDPHAVAFLRKRVLRIYPGFVVAFLLSVFVVGAIGAADAMAYFRALHLLHLLKTLVLLKMPYTPPTFSGSHYPAVNGAMWTIRFEFMCYLLILGLGLAGALRSKWPVLLLWAISLSGFLVFRFLCRHLPFTGAVGGGDMVTLARFVPIFLSGAVLYKTGWHKKRQRWLIMLALAVLIAGLFNKLTAEPALATAGAYLILMFGAAVPKPRFLAKMPDISYGVYLYGWPSEKLIIFSRVSANPLAVFAMSLAMAMLLAWLSWRLVEGPALKFKKTGQSSVLSHQLSEAEVV